MQHGFYKEIIKIIEIKREKMKLKVNLFQSEMVGKCDKIKDLRERFRRCIRRNKVPKRHGKEAVKKNKPPEM